uniref:Uncharacterized protein n=1 Tax=Paramormyrops kingsleyae TaxID=1676925 RepID=A0A3B3RDZ3_9TELE
MEASCIALIIFRPRSRGKAAGEDEDSMDGTEAAESESPQQMETKEPQEVSEGGQPTEGSGEPAISPSTPPQHPEPEPWAESASSEARGSEQLCALCHCGARSLLGQGELRWFGPQPGQIPQADPGGSGGQRDQEQTPSSTAPSRPAEEPPSKLWDELGQVGLPDDTDARSLFDPAGRCLVHQRCASWSEVFSRGEGQALIQVERAIHSGSTQRCAYCKRLGASVRCCEKTCQRSYHYPCAPAAGTFQDIRSYSLLCPEHIQQAVERAKEQANCAVCDSPGDLHDQLFCTSCGQHYHGVCLDVAPTPLKRAGWQCPECKVCQTCKNPGEDSKMLVCDMCDKGYHTFCLQPVMESIPTNGWRCKYCRVCIQCGTRSSAQWHHNCLLCESCFQQQDPTGCCLVCGNAGNPELHKDVLSCHLCRRWLHPECEQPAERDADAPQREDYVCADCRQAELDGAPEEGTHGVTEPAPAADIGGEAAEERAADGAAGGGDPEEEPPGMCHGELRGSQFPDMSIFASRLGLIVDDARCCVSFPPSAVLLAPEIDAPEVPTSPASAVVSVEPAAASPSSTRKDECPDTTTGASEPAEPMDCPPEDVGSPPQEAEQTAGAAEKALDSPTKETNSIAEETMEVSPTEHSRMSGIDQAADSGGEGPPPAETGVRIASGSADEAPPGAEPSPPAEADCAPASEPARSDFSPPAEDTPLRPFIAEAASGSPAKLALSPPSAEASPTEPPPSQTAPTPLEHGIPSTTFISMTPKIGMGKPAISKRKFSPGRPRAKQVGGPFTKPWIWGGWVAFVPHAD